MPMNEHQSYNERYVSLSLSLSIYIYMYIYIYKRKCSKHTKNSRRLLNDVRFIFFINVYTYTES